jgi:hypothetical protein
MEDNISQDVNRLNRRVSFLEEELGTSFEEHRFRKAVDSIAPNSATVCYSDESWYGHHAVVTNIDGDDVQKISERAESLNVSPGGSDTILHKVTETSDGLSVEIYTER